jgi:DNA-binding IclR family transcriptional regulator
MDTPEKAAPDYTNESQQLVFGICEFLSQHMLDPQPLSAIVEAMEPASRDQCFRALWNMQKAGWVRQSGKTYELDTTVIRFADRLRREIIAILGDYLGDHHAK